MRFIFIRDHRTVWPIRLMCRVLEVSASGLSFGECPRHSRRLRYAWRKRPESARGKANRELMVDVQRLHKEHRGRYGRTRIHAALHAEGKSPSRGRVARLMRHHGLRALAGRKFKPCTTDSAHSLPIAPNLLQQEFVATAPNQIWLADITYIPTGPYLASRGWLYLAAVLDMATRKIVGWSQKCSWARSHANRAAARSLDDGSPAAETCH